MTRVTNWQGRTVRLLWLVQPGLWRAVDTDTGRMLFVPVSEVPCA